MNSIIQQVKRGGAVRSNVAFLGFNKMTLGLYRDIVAAENDYLPSDMMKVYNPVNMFSTLGNPLLYSVFTEESLEHVFLTKEIKSSSRFKTTEIADFDFENNYFFDELKMGLNEYELAVVSRNLHSIPSLYAITSHSLFQKICNDQLEGSYIFYDDKYFELRKRLDIFFRALETAPSSHVNILVTNDGSYDYDGTVKCLEAAFALKESIEDRFASSHHSFSIKFYNDEQYLCSDIVGTDKVNQGFTELVQESIESMPQTNVTLELHTGYKVNRLEQNTATFENGTVEEFDFLIANPLKSIPPVFGQIIERDSNESSDLSKGDHWADSFHTDCSVGNSSNIFFSYNSNLSLKHNYDAVGGEINKILCTNTINYFKDLPLVEYDLEEILAETPVKVRVSREKSLTFTPERAEVNLKPKTFKDRILSFLS
ncbi:unnamed protein product [Moneuplotes crassus]|uniref:Uncharacterized protein n=1 Tax=Euplotes crassus TaxID=5936 RepID=A0AAD1UPE8_EUPCR|nr:unnamed protein product [Moneuplotes crassus]